MKKTLSLLLVLLMVAVLLPATAELEPGKYPLTEKFGEIELNFLVTDHPAIVDWETNEFVKWIEETTNVDLKFETVPLEGRAEKLSLVLASGTYPDVFMSVGMSSAMISKFGVQEQLFMPLNDLIDKYAPNTLKVFEQYPGSKGLLTQLDGNIYSLPSVNECYHCTVANKFFMNMDWLKAVGMEKPTTLDELYDVLVAFRDKDPNGNGQADEIPLAGAYLDGWNTRTERFIMNAFTYYNVDLTQTNTTSMEAFGLYLEDGKIVTPFEKPEFKEGLKYMRKLVDEKLYYVGSFSQNLNQLTQLAESGVLGATSAGYILFANLGGPVYRQYDYVLPVKGPNGYQNVVSFPHDSVATTGYVLSADCKNPEAAVMVGDLLLSYDASIRGYYGVKGVDWDDADEGALGINGLPALYKTMVPWQEVEPQNQHVVQQTISMRDSTFRLGETSPADVDLWSSEGLETYLYKASAEYKPFARDEKVINTIKFTEEENDELTVLRVELANAIKEGVIGFMTGARDVDADYDAFLAELEGKGLPRLIELHQTQYDAQYAAK